MKGMVLKMLPRPPIKIPCKSEAFMFMLRYLMLINIPFKAEYNEQDGELKYIRIRHYEMYDQEVIKDVIDVCLQLGGYFDKNDIGVEPTHLDLEWT